MGRAGTLSKARRNMRRPRPNRCALRRVVGRAPTGYEVLECQHEVWPRSDIIGPTNAERRRCSSCGTGDRRLLRTLVFLAVVRAEGSAQ